MSEMPVIFCHSVTKYYPVQLSFKSLLTFRFRRTQNLILSKVDFKVHKGEIFGIVGPNGAGKTTILKILCHLTPPSIGNVLICGHDTEKEWHQIINHIGYCISEERSFFWRLTGRQNLQFFADLLELPVSVANDRIEELTELLELNEFTDHRFMNYSSGTKQRMAVARSLLSDPEILLMDEPTKGLDPRAAFRLRSFIKEYISKNGKTAIITTNRVGDIENLCNRIVILNHGRIIIRGGISEIRSSLEEKYGIDRELPFEEIFNQLIRINNEESPMHGKN